MLLNLEILLNGACITMPKSFSRYSPPFYALTFISFPKMMFELNEFSFYLLGWGCKLAWITDCSYDSHSLTVIYNSDNDLGHLQTI